MKISSLCFLFLVLINSVIAQNTEDIVLPTPNRNGGMPLMMALQQRKSSRSFDSEKQLTTQQISNLLWAAYGFNRPGKRTAPSAMDTQEFELYVFIKQGTFVWDAEKNILRLVLAGDNRALSGKQDFVKDASLNLVYVADYSKYSKIQNEEDKNSNASLNCGFIAQNVYLFCSSENLACVVRAWIDREEIHKKLNLSENKKVVISQSVGFNK